MIHTARAAVSTALAAAASLVQAQGYGIADIGSMNCVEANRHIEQGIAAGRGEAAYTAAQMVVRRVCFKRDMSAYVTLLRRAVELGHPPALDDLAYATALGEGVGRDYAAAGALWRRAGSDPETTLDDYSYGVAMTLARLARRYSAETTPFKLSGTYRFRMTVDFEPAALDARRLTVTRLEGPTPGNEEEGAALQRNVERDLADAWNRALRKLPAFDAGRVGAGRHTARWPMRYHGSRDDSPSVEAIDNWLLH